MAWIEKRKHKYLVRWTKLDGKPGSRICPSAGSAKALKLSVEDAISNGRDWQAEITGDETDLEKVTEAYIERRAVPPRALRPRTLHRYAENLDLFTRFLRSQATDFIGSITLLECDLQAARELLDQRTRC